MFCHSNDNGKRFRREFLIYLDPIPSQLTISPLRGRDNCDTNITPPQKEAKRIVSTDILTVAPLNPRDGKPRPNSDSKNW